MSKNQSSIPYLEWPEFECSNEREVFYKALLSLLGPAEWIVIIPNPAPLGAIRQNIEAECGGFLIAIKMQYDGIAWVFERKHAMKTFPEIFHARRPELIMLAFQEKPELPTILQSLQGDKSIPALCRIHFDDGELVQVKHGQVHALIK